jgi:hypothetical protein
VARERRLPAKGGDITKRHVPPPGASQPAGVLGAHRRAEAEGRAREAFTILAATLILLIDEGRVPALASTKAARDATQPKLTQWSVGSCRPRTG